MMSTLKRAQIESSNMLSINIDTEKYTDMYMQGCKDKMIEIINALEKIVNKINELDQEIKLIKQFPSI